MNSNIKLIEDYICDLCDEIFADGIVCDKIYNPEQLVNRSACITDIQSQETDQYAVIKCNVNISENLILALSLYRSYLIKSLYPHLGHTSYFSIIYSF